jgi:hypothetical protein
MSVLRDILPLTSIIERAPVCLVDEGQYFDRSCQFCSGGRPQTPKPCALVVHSRPTSPSRPELLRKLRKRAGHGEPRPTPRSINGSKSCRTRCPLRRSQPLGKRECRGGLFQNRLVLVLPWPENVNSFSTCATCEFEPEDCSNSSGTARP